MFHRRIANRITRVLIYAILEWTLISLLLLNSLFSLLILRFARYFGLKPPCILCSRLDRHFFNLQKSKDSSSYADIICEQHASEISKLGYCSNHRKLVESQSMCHDCSPDVALFRWMREIGIVGVDEDDVGEVKICSCCDAVITPSKISFKGSSLDDEIGDFVINQRELMGSGSDTKFGYVALDNRDEEDDGEVVVEAEKQPLLNDDDDDDDGDIDMNNNEEIPVTEQNLCPDMLPQHIEFYIDHDDYRLIPVDLFNSLKVGKEDNSQDFELILEGDELVPSGCEVVKNWPSIQEEDEQEEINTVEDLPPIYAHGEDEEEEREKEQQISQPHQEDSKNEERKLSTLQEQEVGENKLEDKIERKLPTSQEQVVEEKKLEENIESKLPTLQEQEEEEKKLEEKFEREDEEEGLLQGQDENIEPESMPILKRQEEEDKAIEPTDVTSTLSDLCTESAEEETASHLKSDDETDAESNEDDSGMILIQLEEPPTPCKHEIPIIIVNVVCEVSTSSAHLPSVDENESPEEDTASHLKSDGETDAERNEDDAGKMVIQVEEPPTPCKHEIPTITDNVVNEVFDEHDDKQIQGEVEAKNCRSRETDITDTILNVNVNVGLSQNEAEEDRIPETPTSVESLHNLHKKLSLLGRRESATEESLDGSMISEIEGGGDATVEKLKSDLQAERNELRALYKELEAERNAAAIAANQTMAMITRLQEEKATMQMEALQYQRMMEEQSEYDQEALQMMNELMVKREKEKQDLEKELEVYRKKVIDYEEREKMRVLCRRMDHGSMRSRNSSASCSYGEEESDGLSIDLNHEAKDQEDQDNTHFTPHDENGHQDTPTDAVLNLQDSLASFEEERHAILEQLKLLEEKLFTLAEEEVEHIDNMKPFDQFYEENGKDFELDGCENGFSHGNGNHQQERRINGSMPKRLLPLFDATELLEESPDLNGKEDGFDPLELHKSPTTKFELDKKRVAIEEEVDHVYERLHALEADREFLKHCIGSLRKGDKGLDLLQEILQHLRDLKNVELQVMKNMDHCASV